MTPEERKVLEDAEQQAFDTAQAFYDVPTSGIRPPPLIEETETTLDPQLFGFEFGQQPETEVEPFSFSEGGGPPVCCSIPTLVCDQISASKSKCGYQGFTTSKYYLTAHHTFSATSSKAGCDASIDIDHTGTYSLDGDYNCTGPDCTCSGTYYTNGTLAYSFLCPEGPYMHCSIHTEAGTTCDCDFPCSFTDGAVVDDTHKSSTLHFSPTSHDPGCANSSQDCTGSETFNTTLSSEYTTAMLISNTEAGLPTYSDCFGCDFESCSYPPGESCTCQASRNLTTDETTYSISRFKYKFVWVDPLPTTCKICWIERTYDQDGNIVSDNHMCETVPAGETESSVHEALEPSANGTVGVVFPVGACCTSGVCTVTDEATCESGGGTYIADSCADNPCSPDPC